MESDARKTALSILNKLDKGTTTLDRELERITAFNSPFPERDRSLLNSLVYGVLRWRKRIDWIIARFSKTPMRKIDSRIVNILRLGIFQIVFLDKIPTSAAVNTSVEMSKPISPPWVVRYVNGLLRQITRERGHLDSFEKESDPISRLATETSFPNWLVKRWIERFGFQTTEALCDQINLIPPITIRNNTIRSSREHLVTALETLVDDPEYTAYSPDGISFTHPRIPIHEMPPFKNGWFQVQDEAAQLVTYLLDPKPNESILDACCGLGGKTGHIAQKMDNRGLLLAMDLHEHKMAKLAVEMDRLGISIVKTEAFDLSNPLRKEDWKLFDRILLDAPCSGLGVIRRNPDIKWRVEEKDLQAYQRRQIRFLTHLAPLVKPNGILNYTVCSTEPEETETVASIFLQHHPGFSVHSNPSDHLSKIRPLIREKGYFQTYPSLQHMDGFFSINFIRVIL